MTSHDSQTRCLSRSPNASARTRSTPRCSSPHSSSSASSESDSSQPLTRPAPPSIAALNDAVRRDVLRAAQLAEPTLTAFENLREAAEN